MSSSFNLDARRSESYLLSMLGFALLVIVVAHAVSWSNGPIVLAQIRTQQKLLVDLVNYQRLLSSLDESARAVVISPERAEFRERKLRAIQDLRDQLDQLATDAPLQGKIPLDLIQLATHFRKEIVAKAQEVDRYAMAPGDWGIERFRKKYGVARADHELKIQSLMEETRQIAESAVRASQSRLTLSAGLLILLWAGVLTFFSLRARMAGAILGSNHEVRVIAAQAHSSHSSESVPPKKALASPSATGTQFRSKGKASLLDSLPAAAPVAAAPADIALSSVSASESPSSAPKPEASLVAPTDRESLPALPVEAVPLVVDLSAISSESLTPLLPVESAPISEAAPFPTPPVSEPAALIPELGRSSIPAPPLSDETLIPTSIDPSGLVLLDTPAPSDPPRSLTGADAVLPSSAPGAIDLSF